MPLAVLGRCDVGDVARELGAPHFRLALRGAIAQHRLHALVQLLARWRLCVYADHESRAPKATRQRNLRVLLRILGAQSLDFGDVGLGQNPVALVVEARHASHRRRFALLLVLGNALAQRSLVLRHNDRRRVDVVVVGAGVVEARSTRRRRCKRSQRVRRHDGSERTDERVAASALTKSVHHFFWRSRSLALSVAMMIFFSLLLACSLAQPYECTGVNESGFHFVYYFRIDTTTNERALNNSADATQFFSCFFFFRPCAAAR